MNEPINKVQSAVDQELTNLINTIVTVMSDRYKDLDNQRKRAELGPDSLENMAKIAEVKIRQAQINEIRQAILPMLKKTINRMVITSVRIEES